MGWNIKQTLRVQCKAFGYRNSTNSCRDWKICWALLANLGVELNSLCIGIHDKLLCSMFLVIKMCRKVLQSSKPKDGTYITSKTYSLSFISVALVQHKNLVYYINAEFRGISKRQSHFSPDLEGHLDLNFRLRGGQALPLPTVKLPTLSTL